MICQTTAALTRCAVIFLMLWISLLDGIPNDVMGRSTSSVSKNKLGTILTQETYTYDSQTRLTGYTSPAGSIGYGYDANNNLSGVKSSTTGGYDVSYYYDTLNRIKTVHRGQEGVDPNAKVLAGYNYDANGNITSSLITDHPECLTITT